MKKEYQALPIVIDEEETAVLLHPEWLVVNDAGTRARWFGARQSWYQERFLQKRGCAVVAAALAMAYASHKPQHISLYQPYQKADRLNGAVPSEHIFERQNFLGHMMDLALYIRPALWGVTAKKLRTGIVRFARERGISLTTDIFKAGLVRKRNRKNFKRLVGFILDGLRVDMPVSMLIYSSGQIKEVRSKHWVTIVKIDANTDHTQAIVTVSDHGREKSFSLDKWFYTSMPGGAFVSYHLEGLHRSKQPRISQLNG